MFKVKIFLGDPRPDLNITVLPSTMLEVGTQFNISCDAGKPRFPLEDIRPLPANTIEIIFGEERSECTVRQVNLNEVKHCTYTTTLKNSKAENQAICVARSDIGCRYKIVNITVMDRNISK